MNASPPAEWLDRARGLLAGAGSVVCFSGAGLSAESGVATFRDPAGDGLWDRYDPTALASPQGFAADPHLVMSWYVMRRRQLAAATPNPAHLALAASKSTQITQNVDDLLERAGATDVVHLHGHIGRDRCARPGCRDEVVDLADPPGLRSCRRCRELMRPGVVWFGEMLPEAEWTRAENAVRDCDVMLVVGTSAVVYPAAGLVAAAKRGSAAVIVVNLESSGASNLADVELLGPAGQIVPALLDVSR